MTTNADLFQSQLYELGSELGFDADGGDRSVGLWHLLACAFDWCKQHNVDFDATLAEVREHFRDNE